MEPYLHRALPRGDIASQYPFTGRILGPWSRRRDYLSFYQGATPKPPGSQARQRRAFSNIHSLMLAFECLAANPVPFFGYRTIRLHLPRATGEGFHLMVSSELTRGIFQCALLHDPFKVDNTQMSSQPTECRLPQLILDAASHPGLPDLRAGIAPKNNTLLQIFIYIDFNIYSK